MPSKHWGAEQDKQLSDLVWSGEINPNNSTPDYCFEVTLAFFPTFIGEGRTRRATAVQRLQRKFSRLLLDRELQGARTGKKISGLSGNCICPN